MLSPSLPSENAGNITSTSCCIELYDWQYLFEGAYTERLPSAPQSCAKHKHLHVIKMPDFSCRVDDVNSSFTNSYSPVRYHVCSTVSESGVERIVPMNTVQIISNKYLFQYGKSACSVKFVRIGETVSHSTKGCDFELLRPSLDHLPVERREESIW